MSSEQHYPKDQSALQNPDFITQIINFLEEQGFIQKPLVGNSTHGKQGALKKTAVSNPIFSPIVPTKTSPSPSPTSIGKSLNNILIAKAIEGLEITKLGEGDLGGLQNITHNDAMRGELFAGEQVHKTVKNKSGFETSVYTMTFHTDRKLLDDHIHSHDFGERLLFCTGDKPWFLHVGGFNNEQDNGKDVRVLKIEMKANTLYVVRFQPGVIHGFEGPNFSILSVHTNDKKEKQLAKENTASQTTSQGDPFSGAMGGGKTTPVHGNIKRMEVTVTADEVIEMMKNTRERSSSTISLG